MSDPSYKLPDEWVEVFHKAREDVIEECARALEQEAGDQELIHLQFALQTIRALKK